jgi:hypothetical protein
MRLYVMPSEKATAIIYKTVETKTDRLNVRGRKYMAMQHCPRALAYCNHRVASVIRVPLAKLNILILSPT